MADDGLLLNFSIGDAPFIAKSSFKGGRWKDRLTAKKAASNWQKKHANSTPQNQEQSALLEDAPVDLNDRPAKRQRIEGVSSKNQNVPRTQACETNKQPSQANQFVSSLFTSNPKPQTVADNELNVQDETYIEPSNAPLTSELENFTSLGLSSTLASHLLNKLGIRFPTAIQKEAVAQLVKEDTDAFIQAETGSGKTLAYLLPIVQRLMALSTNERSDLVNQKHTGIRRDTGLFALLLAPTRELCRQISVVLDSLLRCAHWIIAGTVAGGENKKSEKARLRKGLNILVATPGRLADHLANTQVLDVSRVKWLVLDEGDRLMELGFEKDIQRILSNLNLQSKKKCQFEVSGLPSKRTTILCSATMKMEVQRLKDLSLKDPAFIQVEARQNDPINGNEGEKHGKDSFSAPAQLKQSYAIVPAKLRLVSLAAVLKRAFATRGSVTKAIVFVSCADSVNFHFDLLAQDHNNTQDNHESESDSELHFNPKKSQTASEPRTSANSSTLSKPENPVQIFRLHGSLPQSLRTSTLSAYSKTIQAAVLFCTDVASRGLDLPNVDFVLEYDPAFSKDDHVHRVGRTARAGRDGRALIFLMPGEEENYVQILKQGRRDSGIGVARRDADELLQRGFGAPTKGPHFKTREWEDRATDWQLGVERWVQESPKNLEQARRAFQSHVRAYATHVAAERQFFNIKTLHLGHLAKAFALRDKPGSLKVPGMRPGNDDLARDKVERKMKAGSSVANQLRRSNNGGGKSEYDAPRATEMQEAARKMRAKMKQMSGASEFNLG